MARGRSGGRADKEQGDRPIALLKVCGAQRRSFAGCRHTEKSDASAVRANRPCACPSARFPTAVWRREEISYWLASCIAALASVRSVPGTEGARDLFSFLRQP
jgi:hypothetical protein